MHGLKNLRIFSKSRIIRPSGIIRHLLFIFPIILDATFRKVSVELLQNHRIAVAGVAVEDFPVAVVVAVVSVVGRPSRALTLSPF